MLVVLDPETFPFEDLEDDERDVPLVVFPGSDFSPSAKYLQSVGPFDTVALTRDHARPSPNPAYRTVVVEAAGSWRMLERLRREVPEAPRNKRLKGEHRIKAQAMRSAISHLKGKLEFPGNPSSMKAMEVLREGAVPLLTHSSVEYDLRASGVEVLASGEVEAEGFDVVFGGGLLQPGPPEFRGKVLAGMWRAVRPGGRIVLVDDFVFCQEAREGLPVRPVSVAGYVAGVLKATSGRVVLDHMQSLKYPSDDVFRAAIFSLYRL